TLCWCLVCLFFLFQAEDGIRDRNVTGVQTCALPIFPDMIFGCAGEQLYRDDLNKVSYLLGSYQDFLDTKAQFPDMQNGTWGGAGETALFGDIGVKDITKGNAIAHLLEYLGADVKDTIAFGDAKVDIP